MDVVEKMRLNILAEHLEDGKLAHDAFDFSVYHFNPVEVEPSSTCGTVGCALGECPGLFPKDWYFSGPVPRLTGTEYLGAYTSASIYFGISYEAAQHLFSPNDQKPALYGGKILGPDATRYEVAENIREFIKRKESTLGNLWMAVGEYIWKIVR
jgi:hypothetical protein